MTSPLSRLTIDHRLADHTACRRDEGLPVAEPAPEAAVG